MSMQRSIRTPLVGAIAFALFGIASIATAQTMPQQPTTQQVPPPPPPPPPPQQPAMPPPPPPPATPMSPQSQQQSATPAQQQGMSGQFYQGTESTATYPAQDGNGTLTVNSGMPQHVKNYGPPPSFKSLDTNHDGRISQTEAKAYPPLDSDFLHASRQGKTTSRAQYKRWAQNQH